MELDRETQIRILEEHFTGCLKFLESIQGMGWKKAAEESALRELRQVKNNPVFPLARVLWIRQSWRKVADRIQQEKQ